jgi:PD-(D/E)XK endonuclease
MGQASRTEEGWGTGMGSERRRPGNRKHTKDRGDLAEMRFMVEAARRGFAVAKPFGDNEHYDQLVDGGNRIWRVQVKLSGARHHRGFTVRSSWRTSHKQIAYMPEEVDFLVVVIDGRGIWYVIPVRALGGRLTIHLYPFGSRRGSSNRFEKYREAWGLLEGWTGWCGRECPLKLGVEECTKQARHCVKD